MRKDKKGTRDLLSYVEDDTKKVIPKSSKEFNVEDILNDYKSGAPTKYITKKYDISFGQLYTYLNRGGVPKRSNSSKLQKKLGSLTKNDINNIIKDYKSGVAFIDIATKYDLHKNGLYYILDTHKVSRRGRHTKKGE